MASKARVGVPIPRTAIAFKPEYLNFQRGIHVGNLEDNERITRILKLELESRFRQGFVMERWGRGIFWQWIGYLPRANREAKPISSAVSFGCSKFFISVDTEDKVFQSGLQIERGYLRAPRENRACQLRPDWDWNRLVNALRPRSRMERDLRRLVMREGFKIWAGSWHAEPVSYSKSNFPSMRELRRVLDAAPARHWAGFQLYYPMTEDDVRGSTGLDLVESMLAVFAEVTTAMNLTMQIAL